MKATVVKHTGSHYLLSQLPEWQPFSAVIKGKLRLEGSRDTNPIAVGDVVECEGGAIKEIYPRRNCIVRRSTNLSRQNHIIAANIDMVFLVVTLTDPEPKAQFIDRFLVTSEAYGVTATIILNKADLYGSMAQEVTAFKEIYEKAGYEIIETSAKENLNINLLRERCKDKIVLFSGQSGVGKSSLVNALDPDLHLKTEAISEAHNQGKHTTTFYEMHPLSSGGFIIDTPGIRGFGLVDIDKEELSNYFPEMLRVEDGCKYAPCTHTHEAHCAVKEAVKNGSIALERYNSYLAMLENDDKKYREGDE